MLIWIDIWKLMEESVLVTIALIKWSIAVYLKITGWIDRLVDKYWVDKELITKKRLGLGR